MKKEIYMHVTITEYGTGRIDCRFTQSIDGSPLEINEIPLEKARKLMWELVLAGGKREININRYDRDIVTRCAYIFLPN